MKEWMMIPIFLMAFVLVHLFKMIRLYLVLMEQNISFRRFVLIYLKTTFVNLLIPFKLGEIYRVYCLGRETGRFPIGVMSVITDRFYDTAALLLILVPLQLLCDHKLSIMAIGMVVLLVMLWWLYLMFEPVYQYLNQYIIKHKKSLRALFCLRILDHMNDWFRYVCELVKGRSPLIALFSFLGWGVEILALYLLAGIIHFVFGLREISAYFSAIFLSGKSSILNYYTWIGATIIGVATLIGYLFFRKEDKSIFRNENP